MTFGALKKLAVLALLAGILTLMALTALADGRINVVHHFGGDALYCTPERGCWMLNMYGHLLWEQPQSIIEEAMTTACISSVSHYIEVGVGTYGPVTLKFSCYAGIDPSITMTGYDEWGALNSMTFSPGYAPVNPPHNNGSKTSGALSGGGWIISRLICQYPLGPRVGEGGQTHGYDIYDVTDTTIWLGWSETDLGYPECVG